MHIRPNTLVADDLDDIHVTASSAEPMRRADHKSKKHGRPPLAGGRFVFRRGCTSERIQSRDVSAEYSNARAGVSDTVFLGFCGSGMGAGW